MKTNWNYDRHWKYFNKTKQNKSSKKRVDRTIKQVADKKNTFLLYRHPNLTRNANLGNLSSIWDDDEKQNKLYKKCVILYLFIFVHVPSTLPISAYICLSFSFSLARSLSLCISVYRSIGIPQTVSVWSFVVAVRFWRKTYNSNVFFCSLWPVSMIAYGSKRAIYTNWIKKRKYL